VIVTYQCVFSEPLALKLGERFGPRVEAECIHFLNDAPIEWRITPDDWRSGERLGVGQYLKFFHDLQRPVLGNGTRGISIADATLETFGIGVATVLINLRLGTYPETGTCG
jgi:hypothetical protein